MKVDAYSGEHFSGFFGAPYVPLINIVHFVSQL